jgi:DNA-directed RNA polymerase subunit RPC12/RpoP
MAISLSPAEKKRHVKDLYLRKNYGITIEQFDEILAFQGGKCALSNCGKDLTADDARPNLDHDHRTKYLRGIVCNYCNHWVIGNLSLKQARAVADYLACPPAVAAGFAIKVPPKKRKKRKPAAKLKVTQGAPIGSTTRTVRRRTTGR